MSATKHHPLSSGFTLVELLIAISLVTALITVFVANLLSMIATADIQKTQLELSEQSQIALDTIERDVRTSLAFDTTTNYSTFTDNYGPSYTNEGWTGAWSYKGTDTTHRVLILRQNATTTNPLRASRTPVYIQGFVSNVYAETDTSLNCTAYDAITAPTGALTYNTTLPYYLIYFVRDSNLYRRTLTDTTTALCNAGYQKQSCPSVDTSRPTTCKADDELIAQNVSGFTVTYYSQSDSSSTPTFSEIDAYSSTDPNVFSEVSNILVTISSQKRASGRTQNTTLSVRVSRVN